MFVQETCVNDDRNVTAFNDIVWYAYYNNSELFIGEKFIDLKNLQLLFLRKLNTECFTLKCIWNSNTKHIMKQNNQFLVIFNIEKQIISNNLSTHRNNFLGLLQYKK